MSYSFNYTSRARSFFLVIIILIVTGIWSFYLDTVIHSGIVFWTMDILSWWIVCRIVSMLGVWFNLAKKNGTAYIGAGCVVFEYDNGEKKFINNPQRLSYCENTLYNKLLGTCWDLMTICSDKQSVTLYASRDEFQLAKDERSLYILTDAIRKELF